MSTFSSPSSHASNIRRPLPPPYMTSQPHRTPRPHILFSLVHSFFNTIIPLKYVTTSPYNIINPIILATSLTSLSTLMENPATSTVDFALLPSDLIQYIFFRLTLPDIFRIKYLNKSIASIVSDHHFARNYARKTSSAAWIFIYRNRWHRDGTLHGFIDSTDRWFKISISNVLESFIGSRENLYFLTASGNHFLFVLNTSHEVISVNPVTKIVKKIPHSPLGPRGTYSWRRCGMKLISDISFGSGHFRFLFAEIHENSPVVFEYSSETDTWRSRIARDDYQDVDIHIPRGENRGGDYIFLNAINRRTESVIIVIRVGCDDVMIVRPRFYHNVGVQSSAVGLSWGNMTNHEVHIHGDGYVMIVRSDGVDCENKKKSRVLIGVELWGLGGDGEEWEFISEISSGDIDKIKKVYGVMMGCLEEREGKIRGVLMSYFEGVWDMIWVCYDVANKEWNYIQLPDCTMKGSNMAGISFSSGLTLC